MFCEWNPVLDVKRLVVIYILIRQTTSVVTTCSMLNGAETHYMSVSWPYLQLIGLRGGTATAVSSLSSSQNIFCIFLLFSFSVNLFFSPFLLTFSPCNVHLTLKLLPAGYLNALGAS